MMDDEQPIRRNMDTSDGSLMWRAGENYDKTQAG
jgi:hypothetical protein